MPESKVRKTAAYTPPAQKSGPPKPSPRWYAPVMVTLLLVGLTLIVVFYITQTKYPIPGIGNWNLVLGFGVLLTGFGMTTHWR
ncbi:MAG: hypothetical protein QG608_3159 [Actinomycetota bacterium]|nr:hypothetical protein [Actinomycetota bacterium]